MRFITYAFILLIGMPLRAMEPIYKEIDTDKEFNYLQKKSNRFFMYCDQVNKSDPLPITNRIKSFVEKTQDKPRIKKQIVEDARSINVLIDPKCLNFFEEYLNFKKEKGTPAEKELYAHMNLPSFIYRLYYNRPLSFYGRDDRTFLRPDFAMHFPAENKHYLTNPPGGSTSNKDPRMIGNGYLFFKNANQKYEILADYLSYPEISLAALMGLSCPTFFINEGGRFNSAEIKPDIPHELHGVYTGFVGARFEQESEMEYRHMLITDEQNILDKGYGKEGVENPELDLWKKLYDVDYFFSYDEAEKIDSEEPNRFFTTEAYIAGDGEAPEQFFDKNIYKKRLEFSVSTFLRDANQRAQEANKKAYVHFVGLGLGTWAEDKTEQAKLVLETVAKVVKENGFSHISDINFSHFPLLVKDQLIESTTNGGTFKGITIYFSQRNPAAKLIGKDEGKLLVASYAWDGNAFPGNEYWLKYLTLSDDPAAVCCSLIGELQNPLINGHYIYMSILSAIARYMPEKKEEMLLLMQKAQAEYKIKVEKQEEEEVVDPEQATSHSEEQILDEKRRRIHEELRAFRKRQEEQNQTEKESLSKSQQPKETIEQTKKNPVEYKITDTPQQNQTNLLEAQPAAESITKDSGTLSAIQSFLSGVKYFFNLFISIITGRSTGLPG